MRLKVAMVCILGVVFCCALPVCADFKIGVLAKRGPEVANQRWGPLGKLLSESMGETVTFVPLKFTEIMEWSLNNKNQFLFANSWFYVRAKAVRGAKAPGER